MFSLTSVQHSKLACNNESTASKDTHPPLTYGLNTAGVLKEKEEYRFEYSEDLKNHEYVREKVNEEKYMESQTKRHLEMNENELACIPKRVTISKQLTIYEIPETSKYIRQELDKELVTEVPGIYDLQYFKSSDRKYFGILLDDKPDSELTNEELKQRQILRLILRAKNSFPSGRKVALKMLTNKAHEFGASSLFNGILPILSDKNLEDQERYLMIKLMDRVMYKLGEVARPYTKKILLVTCPLLIDDDPIVRNTGNDIISNLSKAVGLGTMISTMRPDLDNMDESIRNITAKAMAVCAKALGVPQLIPFIKAVCRSKQSWRIRYTGIKLVHHLSILLGIGVLPHITGLIDCISFGLWDEQPSIKIITAHAIASLAKSCNPYGIEAFDTILEPLWKGLKNHRGKALAAFLKAFGFLIPLMDSEYAGYYTKEVMHIVKREFASPDDEMKKTVLLVIQKCSYTEGVTPRYLREQVAPQFFKYFWIRRIALDRQINKMVTYTTVVLSEKIGCSFTLKYLLGPLKDQSEPFRTMAVHATNKIVKLLGTMDIDDKLQERLIDALLIAFQEQTIEDRIIFKGFGTVVNSFDKRMMPYLDPIVSTILNRLKHKLPVIRQYAADLCTIVIPIIKSCQRIDMINKLNIILYESLGEVYPDALGSIIAAMNQIVSISDLKQLQPPVNQILPTLTPILRNRHKKVQESTINIVGNFANRAPEYVSPKEWMRICFELLEMLKSPSKPIRMSANTTFGYIAKAIGPQNVLVALLNNLKVQERQLRVCSAVAIGIVAETCGPFTVLPILMNEYKTPDTNVQNGVLKAMSFMFEYIGDMSADYLYIISPLLQDALIDRDLVHRQTAATVLRHLALNCSGMGYEDVFIHMLNLLMPNIFETSPHVIARILEGLEALRNAIGAGAYMNYIWAGLFHPSRNVRRIFWKLYNNSYIQNPDYLIPYYPAMMDENLYSEELNLIL